MENPGKTINKGQSGAEALASSNQSSNESKVTSLKEIDNLTVSEVRQYHLTSISKRRLNKLLQNNPDFDKVKRQVNMTDGLRTVTRRKKGPER